ncbi:hypothetical protein AURANDRAFT_68088 [Aureococcus anophagefferens]|uniref:Uncharacterized protein n=1 Tax=Aureococcus anophagefferens TaxID=44056 RepID=F0YNF9_AURAN|nr:hypothetical protein AURANDRAFT_68088 [Aureococcus anophagefferens]EGB03352.1 hypothetical protein AURANDRAFT_68088 [Aureococcus anophagefferens]|eukprot:XP_009041963.1 hypothetical protein AURANDRAFT_68088 [Aureococcus anophagefferens]
MGGSDDSDDDVPVSRLRGQRGDPPHSAAYRDSRKRTSEASDPSRAEKQPAVGYTAAKAGAELVAAELKRAQQLRDGAPASRQCADYVLERIRAVPEHAWSRAAAGRYDAPGSFHAAFVVHLGAKRCLEALEIALGTASDALAAATGAGEARDDAARRRACAAALRGEAPDDGGGLARLRDRLQRLAAGAAAIPKKEAGGLWALLRDAEAEAAGRRPAARASKKLAVRARLSGAVVAGGDLVAVVQDVRGAFKALPPRGAAAARAPAPPPAGSAEKRPPKVARLRKDATEDERIAAMLAALADYVASFSATIEVRKEGSTAGTSDIYYYDGGGRRFRSRAEAALEITTNAAVAQFLRRCLAWHRPALLDADRYPADGGALGAGAAPAAPAPAPGGAAADDDAWDFDAEPRGRVVVEALGALAGARAAAGAAERFAEARSLHADDAPRPAAPPRGRWAACASAVAARLAAHDDAARAAGGPGDGGAPDAAAARDRAVGDVYHGLAEPLAWADGDAVDPLAAATDKLRCGGAYGCLAAAERAALLGALARGAARAAAGELRG